MSVDEYQDKNLVFRKLKSKAENKVVQTQSLSLSLSLFSTLGAFLCHVYLIFCLQHFCWTERSGSLLYLINCIVKLLFGTITRSSVYNVVNKLITSLPLPSFLCYCIVLFTFLTKSFSFMRLLDLLLAIFSSPSHLLKRSSCVSREFSDMQGYESYHFAKFFDYAYLL